jgi:hypothetical protein
MWDDALRLARQFRPADVRSLQLESNRLGTSQPRIAQPGENILKQARDLEEKSDYGGAVKLYLRCKI